MSSENFDLCTAIECLPVINGDEEVTRALIDGIDFYSSLLNESGKKILINFVLKTRLNKVGKFYLKSEYENVDELIKDMKKYLLPKKSHPALQIQMLNCRQGYRSLVEFGQEIEYLLTELTLAQLDFLDSSEEESRKILLKVNEKSAVKCFCDGLRNSRLRLFMACKQPKSLSEAIQIALDEEYFINLIPFKLSNREKFIQKKEICNNLNEKINVECKNETKSTENVSENNPEETFDIVKNKNDELNVENNREINQGHENLNSNERNVRKRHSIKNQELCIMPPPDMVISQSQRNSIADVPSVRRTSIPKCALVRTKVMKCDSDMDNGIVGNCITNLCFVRQRLNLRKDNNECNTTKINIDKEMELLRRKSCRFKG